MATSSAHERAIAEFLVNHFFEVPDGPTLPPLDVAERDVTVLALALAELATALGLEGTVSFTRSLIPHPRGMIEIRQKLAMLRAALALACIEMGVPDSHLAPDPEHKRKFAELFVRGRRLAAQSDLIIMQPRPDPRKANAASKTAAILLKTIGMAVIVKLDGDRGELPSHTSSLPWRLGHGAWVVKVVGLGAGGYDCNRVKPNPAP